MKRKRKTSRSKRKVKKMARRRSYTRRVYTKARRSYRRRKGLLSGNMGNVVVGAVAGAVGDYIPPLIGVYTKPVAFAVGGYLLKKPALLSIAGYEAGKIAGSMFLGGGGMPGGQAQV